MADSKHESGELLQRLRNGDNEALARLFLLHRERLSKMVTLRLDSHLASRVDADDILQEAFIDAAQRVKQYVEEHSGSFYVWLRMIVCQTMVNVHRRHVGAQRRNARRDVSIHRRKASASTSLALQLLGDLTSPSNAVMRDEMAERLQRAVEEMDEIDREVLTLRHFEQLTNQEVAEVLQIKHKAASIRYIRAIKRLKEKLAETPGFEQSH